MLLLEQAKVGTEQAAKPNGNANQYQGYPEVSLGMPAAQWPWQSQPSFETYNYYAYPEKQPDNGADAFLGISSGMWVAIFTLALVVTTIVQAVLILRAESLTRAALRVTQRQFAKSRIDAIRRREEAERTLAQAKLAAESELRAWVDVDVELTSFESSTDNIRVGIDIRLTNVGRTPALNVATSQKVRAARSVVLNRGGLPAIEKYPTAMPSIMPGKDAMEGFGLRIHGHDIEKCIAECQQGVGGPTGLMVIVDVIAYYRTIFDEPDAKMHMTSIRYDIHSSLYFGPRDERSRSWIRSVADLSEVQFAQDRSAPVYMT